MSNAIEAELRRAGAAHPRMLAGPASVEPQRLGANRAAVDALLLAPSPSWLERLLRRLGVGEAATRLVTATPGLRRAWLVAVAGALLFALSAASTSTDAGPDRIVTFLTVAPLVPLLGVALAFGSGVDPTNETLMAAPIDGFRVFVLRAVTVLTASIVILGVASVLVPEGGWHRVAWLCPALAVTSCASALSTRLEPRRAATVVGVAWLVGTIVVANIPDQPSDAFGPAMQILSLLVAAGAGTVLIQRRRCFDIGVAGR